MNTRPHVPTHRRPKATPLVSVSPRTCHLPTRLHSTHHCAATATPSRRLIQTIQMAPRLPPPPAQRPHAARMRATSGRTRGCLTPPLQPAVKGEGLQALTERSSTALSGSISGVPTSSGRGGSCTILCCTTAVRSARSCSVGRVIEVVRTRADVSGCALLSRPRAAQGKEEVPRV